MSAPGREWREGWSTLLGAVLGMATGISLFGTVFGFFVKPLAAEFGWSRGVLGLNALALLGTALAMPAVGMFVDRTGGGRLILWGSLMFAAAYLALASMSGALWQYLAIIGFLAVAAGPATAPLVVTRPLINAFVQARGLALAIGMSGSVLIAALVLPLLQRVIAEQGWRVGFAALAPLCVGLGVASHLLLRRRTPPSGTPAHPVADAPVTGHSFREALKDPRFWLLGLSAVLICFASGAFSSQLQPMLSDRGVPGATAALLGAWYAGSVIVGRLSVGLLLDRLWPPAVGALSLLGPLPGMLLLLTPQADLPVLMLAVGLVGLSSGAEGDLLAFFAARYFGGRAFGAIFGLLGLFLGLAVGVGATAGGFVFDLAGDYRPLLKLGAGLAVASSLALFISGRLRTAPEASSADTVNASAAPANRSA